MGTAGSTKGSGANTSLVPTWMDEPASGPLPGNEPAIPENGGEAPDGDAGTDDGPDNGVMPARPDIVPPPEPERFRGARGNFTTFARSGGNDRPAMRRAARDYVRSGTRGSGNAVRRMGSSRAAAGGLLGVFRGIQRDGLQETLRYLNLGHLVGRSTRDVFLGLTDVICRDGGPIDDAIARDAWLETVAELDGLGIDNIDALTADQVRDVFLTFVANAVETKLLQEVGVNGFKVADLDSIEAFQEQFRSYIERSVRDSFASDLTQLATFSDQQIRTVVDQTYKDAWDLLETLGDQP